MWGAICIDLALEYSMPCASHTRRLVSLQEQFCKSRIHYRDTFLSIMDLQITTITIIRSCSQFVLWTVRFESLTHPQFNVLSSSKWTFPHSADIANVHFCSHMVTHIFKKFVGLPGGDWNRFNVQSVINFCGTFWGYFAYRKELKWTANCRVWWTKCFSLLFLLIFSRISHKRDMQSTLNLLR